MGCALKQHPNKVREDTLYQVAQEQLGLFTARQAVQSGFDKRNHPYHVKTGNWKKEYRGIYRLKNFPSSPLSQYVLWSLWSCNRKGEAQAVISHETALSVYDLSDIAPAKISITVPLNFRKDTTIPAILVLHKAELSSYECRSMEGFRVTTPTRTLRDVIFADHIPKEIICQVIEEGFSRGLYPKKEMERYGIFNLSQEILSKHAR